MLIISFTVKSSISSSSESSPYFLKGLVDRGFVMGVSRARDGGREDSRLGKTVAFLFLFLGPYSFGARFFFGRLFLDVTATVLAAVSFLDAAATVLADVFLLGAVLIAFPEAISIDTLGIG